MLGNKGGWKEGAVVGEERAEDCIYRGCTKGERKDGKKRRVK